MIPDESVIILTGVVALCTLVAAIAYIFLINKFKQSISSNDGLKDEIGGLKNELCSARSEISQLRSDLVQAKEDKTKLKKALDECLEGHAED